MGNRLPACVEAVALGNDRDHPGKRLRRRRIDRANLGMGIWRAQDAAEKPTMRVSVFEKIAAADKRPLILEAGHRPACTVFAHALMAGL